MLAAGGSRQLRSRLARTLVATALCMMASGCGGSLYPQSRLTVDATVASIADIVRQVVGDKVDLVALIPEGVDSHTFEASPMTVRSLSRADVVFMGGLHLESSILKQARAVIHDTSKIVLLGNKVLRPSDYAFDFTFPRSSGSPNPHLWTDPIYTKRWAEIVRDTMSKRDPSNAPYYRANEQRFAAALDALDKAITTAIGSIPSDQRLLLTYHDSFAYFARRYDVRVLGAVQPNDFSEPSPQEVRRLIEQVRSNRVPAIFGSEVFPSKILEQVARETGAKYVDSLRDDELPGTPGNPEHTYLAMMVEDVTTIVESLGGDASPMTSVPTSKTYGS